MVKVAPVVIDVFLIGVNVMAVMIDVPLIDVAVFAVGVNVCALAANGLAILGELGGARTGLLVCLILFFGLGQVAPITVDVALVGIAVAAILGEVAFVTIAVPTILAQIACILIAVNTVFVQVGLVGWGGGLLRRHALA